MLLFHWQQPCEKKYKYADKSVLGVTIMLLEVITAVGVNNLKQ